MPGPIAFVLLLLAGAGMGVIFYGGLWLTVRALAESPHPVLMAVASFWGRTAVVVAGLALLMGRRWQNAIVCLVGFVAARLLLSRWIPGRPPARRGRT
jgi:F1F0 ATPase subunit 2